mmetsp:Transcript_13602/g.13181  ORF Transcript_13602/g.13181 Transcript_13602/m.13181 type:complete len:440 (-) Transcript_13602:24-1343(-)
MSSSQNKDDNDDDDDNVQLNDTDDTGKKDKKTQLRARLSTENALTTTGQHPTTTSELPLDWTQLAATSSAAAVLANVRYPLDVVPAEEFQDEEVYAVGTNGIKITHMGPDLYQHAGPNVTKLIFRSHLIVTMEGLSQGWDQLKLLELYDNQIERLADLDNVGPRLTTLDMSYNVIRDMTPVHCCSNLVELYLANNKLKSLAGLENMTQLKRIDLGANRIRTMQPEQLANLVNLEELWLGKNKIERIQGLEPLTKLRKLDVQSNRLTKIDDECLSHVASTLEELYLAHNGLNDEGAITLSNIEFKALTTIDLSRNILTTTKPFAQMYTLEDLWISGNNILTFDDVEPISVLGTRDGANLETVYLEYNPLDKDSQYRKKLQQMIPSLKQIDANMIVVVPRGLTLSGRGGGPVVVTESLEDRMKRMQAIALAKARAQTLEQS